MSASQYFAPADAIWLDKGLAFVYLLALNLQQRTETLA